MITYHFNKEKTTFTMSLEQPAITYNWHWEGDVDHQGKLDLIGNPPEKNPPPHCDISALDVGDGFVQIILGFPQDAPKAEVYFMKNLKERLGIGNISRGPFSPEDRIAFIAKEGDVLQIKALGKQSPLFLEILVGDPNL